MPMWLHYVIVIGTGFIWGWGVAMLAVAAFPDSVLAVIIGLFISGGGGYLMGTWYVRTFMEG